MVTSSITKNFVVYGKEQAERFADAIEESYQESLHRTPEPDMKITYLKGSEQIKQFMEKRKKTDVKWYNSF